MMLKKYLVGIAIAITLASCSAPKKVIYLKDAEKMPTEVLSQANSFAVDPVLMPGDILNIRVYDIDPAAVAPFNKGQHITAEGTVSNTNLNNGGRNIDNYLIDKDGNINFPILGTMHVAGKTKQQVSDEILAGIYPKYVKVAPQVEVRLDNFRVTMLGAVNSPGIITSEKESMNILEAIAQAGDLALTGERDNVMLIRSNKNGKREIHSLNLNDRNLLLSPYFNLQQDDVIYVEPNRSARQGAWQMHQGWSTTIAVVSGLSSIAGLVIGIVNLSK